MKGRGLDKGLAGGRFVEEFFSGISRQYDLILELMTFVADRRWKRIAFRAAGVNGDDCVLDAAAGTGIFTFKIARALHLNGSVFGIDVTRPMLEVAKAKHRRLKMPALSGFGCAVAEAPPS